MFTAHNQCVGWNWDTAAADLQAPFDLQSLGRLTYKHPIILYWHIGSMLFWEFVVTMETLKGTNQINHYPNILYFIRFGWTECESG